MKYDPTVHHRHSIRLKGYDYTQPGAYFVTLVTYQREYHFGEIVSSEIRLSEAGQVAAYYWNKIPEHFPLVSLDEWIIMPNHLHGIIILSKGEASAENINLPPTVKADASPQRPIGTTSGSLGAILQNFKSITSRKINQAKDSLGFPLWQRNYYEHIIRNEREWQRIRDYIQINPQRWQEDQLRPNSLK